MPKISRPRSCRGSRTTHVEREQGARGCIKFMGTMTNDRRNPGRDQRIHQQDRPTPPTKPTKMKTSLAFLSLVAGAKAFVPVAPMVSARAAVSSSATSRVQHVPMRMGLNPELAANFPRDFANVSRCCWLLLLPLLLLLLLVPL